MGAVVSCFHAIGDCIMTVINAIAGVIMAIVNGIVAVLKAIVSFLTCKFTTPASPGAQQNLDTNALRSGGFCSSRRSGGTSTGRRSHFGRTSRV